VIEKYLLYASDQKQFGKYKFYCRCSSRDWNWQPRDYVQQPFVL